MRRFALRIISLLAPATHCQVRVIHHKILRDSVRFLDQFGFPVQFGFAMLIEYVKEPANKHMAGGGNRRSREAIVAAH
jgi:hypothetical protein